MTAESPDTTSVAGDRPLQLHAFQQRAASRLGAEVARLVGEPAEGGTPRMALLESPTGSGKTTMLATALAEAESAVSSGMAVLWLCPGKGQLHRQSHAHLERQLGGRGWIVELLDDTPPSAIGQLSSAEVLVASWEQLTRRDRKSGARVNVATREQERTNLLTIIERTKSSGVALVVVVDESHHTLGGLAARNLLEELSNFGSPVRVEATATPRTLPDVNAVAIGRAVHVRVDPSEPVRAGLIRERVVVNPSVQSVVDEAREADDTVTSVQAIVRAAVARRAALAQRYREIGSPVNPLIGVQLPDGDGGNAIREVVEREFAASGISTVSGRLAVWLNDEHTHIDNISAPDSPVDALLFRHAVALGWDCPRLQVLVLARETRSLTFAQQTLGRGLRTSEGRAYEGTAAADLNAAYVFANVATPHITVDDTGSMPIHRESRTLTRRADATVSECLGEHGLPAAVAVTGPAPGPPPLSFAHALRDHLDAVIDPSDSNAPVKRDLAADASVETVQLSGNAAFQAARVVAVDADARDLDDVVARVASSTPTWGTAATAALIMAARSAARRLGLGWDAGDVKSWVAAHPQEAAAALQQAAEDVPAATPDTRVDFRVWRPPREVELSARRLVPAPGTYPLLVPHVHAAQPSRAEVDFEALLDARAGAGDVRWWLRCGVGSPAWPSLVYADDHGRWRTMWPDYVVEGADATLWVLEVKDGAHDIDAQTPHKALALRGLERGVVGPGSPGTPLPVDVRAGVVACVDGAWLRHHGLRYEPPALHSPVWTRLTDELEGVPRKV